MNIRHSTSLALLTALNLLLLAMVALHAAAGRERASRDLAVMKGLVRELRLTDLCLATEARYTRHPAMADTHAAFQEHPVALDHFPTGSLILPGIPPARLHAHKH